MRTCTHVCVRAHDSRYVFVFPLHPVAGPPPRWSAVDPAMLQRAVEGFKKRFGVTGEAYRYGYLLLFFHCSTAIGCYFALYNCSYVICSWFALQHCEHDSHAQQHHLGRQCSVQALCWRFIVQIMCTVPSPEMCAHRCLLWCWSW
jgi:hypothetical protein